jgi:hypothetical protein
MTNIEKYYNKFHEEHRLKTRHGTVEFLTSYFYINECINKIKEQTKKRNAEIKIAEIKGVIIHRWKKT